MADNQGVSSPSDLDLSQISSDDDAALVSRINTFYTTDATQKAQLSWHWERNQMMLDGRHWIVFDGDRETGGIWTRLRVSKQNEYIPRPVTNYMFSIYQTLKGYFLKEKPRSTVYPNSQDYKDKLGAQIGTLCLEVNWARLKEDAKYEQAVSNVITYGTVFRKDFWDTSTLSLVKVPRMKTVPMSDPTTGAVIGEQEILDTDPITGDPLFDELPLGDVNSYILEPYRICLDPLAMDLYDCRWIMEYSVQPLDWIKETYSQEGEGYTGKADEVKAEKSLNSSMQRWFQLRTSSGNKANAIPGAGSTVTAGTMIDNAAVVKEYYERPSAKHPKGRQIVVAGDVLLYAGDSPYEGPEMGDWHPYSEARWEIVPGRFFGKSPLDDAAEIQKGINSIDSVIMLNRKTMAIPQKLIPNQCGVSPGSWTGRPGQEIFYRPDPSGAEPKTIPGMGVDQSVFAERAQRVSDLKEITGAIDILRGENSSSSTAASALNLMYEVGTGRFYPILNRLKAFVESGQKKQLKLIHNKYKEPRPEFIRMLKAKNKDLAEEDINNFIGTDLNDNCNVTVEAGSNIPKLHAAKQATLLELAQMGMLNLQNPENRVQFQQDMGIPGYDNDIEPDRKRAMWENDLLDNLMQSPDNKPVVLDVDNDDEHINCHTTRMKSPTFMALPFPVQQAYMMHVQQHEQSKAKKMQAQMLQEQAMAPTPGAPIAAPRGQGAAPHPDSVQHRGPVAPGAPQGVQGGHGKGLPKPLKQAVLGADILPASVGKTG